MTYEQAQLAMLNQAAQARCREELAACFETLGLHPEASAKSRAFWFGCAVSCRQGLGPYAGIPVEPSQRRRPEAMAVPVKPFASVLRSVDEILDRKAELMAKAQRIIGIEREPGTGG